ncbi:gliding motility-associated peptidyl-prolyl isomerase GldI [Flavobacterium silvaticum]|uniref:Peptidyl-prolyl cis-trans isomerase n=1 Tax=Flavobacterium silvaticum TaxID=1852020 RepID=A0A972FSW2_9FLAO|nr:gliding motility-associated peptidyl-prolyl isomerase GldI [Flavobacterium silvaticum]NMH27863.1 gliding motility-associated peptidyl-prolyl isomerase GldI [Flavobacterium silvaticum]
MKIKLHIVCVLSLGLLVMNCGNPQPRRPVSRSEGTFMKESIERNKKLVAGEEDKIDSIIKSDPNQKYLASNKGYWYTYITRNTKDTLTPKKGDVAYFDYELSDLDGNVIYTQLELRPQEYHVDKEQETMMGLRHGIKLMRKNETVKFLFPSHMGYGYRGDHRRIGHNEPLICVLTLNDFKPEQTKTTTE